MDPKLDIQDFTNSHDANTFVFRLLPDDEGNSRIISEKKGVWTWLKSVVYSNQYDLNNILLELEKIPKKQENKKDFERIKNRINIEKFTSNNESRKSIISLFTRVFPTDPTLATQSPSITSVPPSINTMRLDIQKLKREKFRLEKNQEKNLKISRDLEQQITNEQKFIIELNEEENELSEDFLDKLQGESLKKISELNKKVTSLTKENSFICIQLDKINEQIKYLDTFLNELKLDNDQTSKNVVDCVFHLDDFIEKQKSYTLSLMKNENIDPSSFPTNFISSKITEETYDSIYKFTCHATALAFIEHFKNINLIKSEPHAQLRENDLEKAKEITLTPFSVTRILATASENSNLHEFVILNLGERSFLIQSDMYSGKELKDICGLIEITPEGIEKIFNSDQETYEDLFELSDQKRACLEIAALDSYALPFS